MTAFYNEIDPRAAHWLDDLQSHGHVAPGTVDTRSIEDLTGADLNGYTQVHLFAGIGGWSHALRLAGVPDGFPVWTGSCPCQPFSDAGKRKGTDDPRHLWPHMRRLIAECRPVLVFGEQVESKAATLWIDRVWADMEALGYAFRTFGIPAWAVNADHIRKRTWWVAADPLRFGSTGLVAPISAGPFGPGGASRQADLLALASDPFAARSGWPQPLLRAGHDDVSSRVVGVHAAGNAIVPPLAAEFIAASLEAIAATAPTPPKEGT